MLEDFLSNVLCSWLGMRVAYIYVYVIFWQNAFYQMQLLQQYTCNTEAGCVKPSADSVPPACLGDSFINAFMTERVPRMHRVPFEISVRCDRC